MWSLPPRLSLRDPVLTNTTTQSLSDKPVIQDYLSSQWRPQALRFLTHGVSITKKRQATLERRISARRAPSTPHPFFTFITRCDDATDYILSFLDQLTYGVERKRG